MTWQLSAFSPSSSSLSSSPRQQHKNRRPKPKAINSISTCLSFLLAIGGILAMRTATLICRAFPLSLSSASSSTSNRRAPAVLSRVYITGRLEQFVRSLFSRENPSPIQSRDSIVDEQEKEAREKEKKGIIIIIVKRMCKTSKEKLPMLERRRLNFSNHPTRDVSIHTLTHSRRAHTRVRVQ